MIIMPNSSSIWMRNVLPNSLIIRPQLATFNCHKNVAAQKVLVTTHQYLKNPYHIIKRGLRKFNNK